MKPLPLKPGDEPDIYSNEDDVSELFDCKLATPVEVALAHLLTEVWTTTSSKVH